MKKMAKSLIAAVLGWQVRRLEQKNDFKIVAVAGSVGKTSTKLAIVKVLQQRYRVQFQNGNYNDIVSVPLIFFSETMPSLLNPVAWMGVFWRNQKKLKLPYPYDVVVIELGTDAPGQIKQFAAYLKIDLGVLTAITAEHMEFFTDLKAVADEELILGSISKSLIVNKDLCPQEYLKNILVPYKTYAVKQAADFRLTGISYDGFESTFNIERGNELFLRAQHESVLEPQLYSVAAAVAVGAELGMSPAQIEQGIRSIVPVSGRMQHLKGVNNSTIIDDTYNSSPEAAKAALETLYRIEAPHKIAVLGNMNELGSYSREAHEELGINCDSKKLELVITIGPDANQFLAPIAASRGCRVVKFDNPYKAGEHLMSIIRPGSLILVKGSQNGVFAEEIVKSILADPSDTQKLVRQSPGWLKKKNQAFPKP